MTMRSAIAGISARDFTSRYKPSDCCADPWDEDDRMVAAARVGAINQQIRDDLEKISSGSDVWVDTPRV